MDDITRSVMDLAQRHIRAESAFALDDPDADFSVIGFGSLEMVSFILDLEASFSIRFPADMMDAETFRNVRTVADSVRELREREKRL